MSDTFHNILDALWFAASAVFAMILYALGKILKRTGSKIAKKTIQDLVISFLKPVVKEILKEELSADIEKIKKATHDKSKMEEGVLERLLEAADLIEVKLKQLGK